MVFLLVEILSIVISVIVMLVIVQFIIGLLAMFNVISMSNPAVNSIYSSLDMILSPILNPIRKILPDTGGIDFSPLVLIVALQILQRVLMYAASATV